MRKAYLKVALVFIIFNCFYNYILGYNYYNYLNKNKNHILADSLNNANEITRALKYYSKALNEYYQEDNFNSYINLSAEYLEAFIDLGKIDEAADFINLSKEDLDKSEPFGKACYLRIAASTYRLKENLEEAKKAIDQSVDIFDSLQNYDNHARALVIRADIFAANNKTEKAFEDYYLAQKIMQSHNSTNSKTYAFVLNRLGLHIRHFGNTSDAKGVFEESVKIASQFKNTKEYTNAIFYQSIMFYQDKDFDEALEGFEKAKSLYTNRFGKDNIRITYVNNLIGNVYTDLRKYDIAEDYFKQAYIGRIKVFGPTHTETMAMLMNTANQQRNQGKYDVALKNYKKVYAAFEKNSVKNYDYYKIKRNIGNLYFDLGEIEKAKKEFKQAEINGKLVLSDDALDWVDLYLDLADINTLDSDKEFYYGKTLNVILPGKKSIFEVTHADFDKIKNPFYLFMLAYEMTQFYFELSEQNNKRENLIKAQKISKMGLMLSQYVRHKEISKGKLDQLFRITLIMLDTSLELAWEIKQENDLDPNINEWISEINEMSKAWILLNNMSKSQFLKQANLPDSVYSNIQEIKLQIDKSYNELSSLTDQEYDKIATLRKSIFDLKVTLKQYEEDVRVEYPDYINFTNKKINFEIDTIRTLLDTAGILMHYTLIDDYLYTTIISQDSFSIFRTETPHIRKDIKDLYSLITKRDQNLIKFDSLRHQISSIVCHPIDDLLKDKKQIIIVPDKILHYLPFDILNRKNKTNYLIEDYNITYTYSASILKELNDNISTSSRSYLAFAPEFKGKGELAYNDSEKINQDVVRGDLSPLPAAQEEVKGLSKYFNGVNQINEYATEASFKEQLQNKGILHFATHAIVDDERPSNSYLVFSEHNEKDDYDDGLLHTWELTNLNINAQLTVLSACNTGYGKLKNGEGFLSLGRAFLEAGSKSVLMTSWPAQDHSTSEIMTTFYEKLSQGYSKDSALRQAKLQFISESDDVFKHPFFWAGFSIHGTTEPLRQKNKSHHLLVIFAIATILILLVTILTKKAKK